MTVLAATDLSGMAFAAVRRAAAIAAARGATLELLHVIDSFSTAWADAHMASGPSASTLTTPAEEGLTAIASAIQAEFGVRANSVVVEGKPAVEIAARSEAVDADVVVLGIRGMDPGLAPLPGTTVQRVLARSRRPVLIVKRMQVESGRSHDPYRHILIGADVSPNAAGATECARALFPEATVTLLHAYQDRFSAKREQPAEGLDPSGHGAAVQRICEHAREAAADLIVVGSERVSLLRRLVIGSVGMSTIAEAACDVLLARTPVPGPPISH